MHITFGPLGLYMWCHNCEALVWSYPVDGRRVIGAETTLEHLQLARSDHQCQPTNPSK